jgi:hypothetical protein
MLAPRARAVLRALVRVILPTRPDVPDRDARIVRYVESFVPHFPVGMRKLFPVGLYLLEWGTLLFALTTRPFSQLPPDRARDYVDSWRHSRFALRRQLIQGVVALAMLGFYSMPEVMAYIGFRHPEHAAERVAFRRALMARAAAAAEPAAEPAAESAAAEPAAAEPAAAPEGPA